jgi:hypothetical protein
LFVAQAAAAELDDDIVVRDGTEYVQGNLFAFVAKLSDEFIRSLQQADPHTAVRPIYMLLRYLWNFCWLSGEKNL